MSLVFSGLLFDDTVVKAVVVSEMVGRGRPMTVTTAAAIPPTKEEIFKKYNIQLTHVVYIFLVYNYEKFTSNNVFIRYCLYHNEFLF